MHTRLMMASGPIAELNTVGYVANIIQTAVAPIFMLAGLGAFLNVCTQRLARIVDRAREIEPELLARRGEDEGQARLSSELHMLDRRMDVVNGAIFCTVLSALLICTVVVLMFADPFIEPPLGAAIAILFMASMVSIGLGFSMFLIETRLAWRFVRVRADLLQHRVDEGE